MKVLFVFRAPKTSDGNPIINNQLESLTLLGLVVDRYCIEKGGHHYFKEYFKLRNHLKNSKYDLVHAHYGYTAILASIANYGKTIASLMGSDIYKQNSILKGIVKLFSKHIWALTIVKSTKMKTIITNSLIVPNGVSLNKFKPEKKEESKLKIGFTEKYNILLIAVCPEDKAKNLSLAKRAINLVNDENIHFHVVSNIDNNRLPLYYSAADLLLLTSTTEGSPNVIKEAMACNCPIVSTDVGDVREVIGNTDGCYLTSFDPQDVASKIKLALEFSKIKGRTNGRDRIIELGLDSESIAKRIIEVYKGVLNS